MQSLKKKSSRYFLPNSFIKSFGTEYEHKAEASVHHSYVYDKSGNCIQC